MSERLIQQIRRARPKLAAEADHENSRKSAIHLCCLECVGGVRSEAVTCTDYACALWPYRPGAEGERPSGVVPTAQEYATLQAEKLGDRAEELKERGRHMAAKRTEKKAESDPFDGLESEDEVNPFE